MECGHVWRIVGAVCDAEGALVEYVCAGCGVLLVVMPGDVHPATA